MDICLLRKTAESPRQIPIHEASAIVTVRLPPISPRLSSPPPNLSLPPSPSIILLPPLFYCPLPFNFPLSRMLQVILISLSSFIIFLSLLEFLFLCSSKLSPHSFFSLVIFVFFRVSTSALSVDFLLASHIQGYTIFVVLLHIVFISVADPVHFFPDPDPDLRIRL